MVWSTLYKMDDGRFPLLRINLFRSYEGWGLDRPVHCRAGVKNFSLHRFRILAGSHELRESLEIFLICPY